MQSDIYNRKLKFVVLGSGTSTGVPTISCKCPTCLSNDPRDKRLRTSLLVQSPNTTVVIDASPDFRQQMLQHNVDKLDAIVFTHGHFDHIGGLDDIRAFNYTTKMPMKIFLDKKTFERIKKTFFYIFEEPERSGGGLPLLDVNFIDIEPFTIGDIKFDPLKLHHGTLEVLGFRIENLAYCTDTNNIPDETLRLLCDLEILLLDALRYEKHSSHFTIEEAISVAQRIKAKRTYLIHLAHQVKHSECSKLLPEGVYLSYDGLTLEL
ncbi:MAG: MBL fold metallo-hydrolase [Ignavibacteria bacterium]|nr:MBL fold metallo-hydrolase [Ignavibacteria bacterium]